ncbi:hypothetical protein GLOIN_2v1869616 [Rhizophagus clarus]|uniref:Uncharacterized protein n=1 Tax=Rhizophagus clarus TaxID=94130 RepID=A0A8H3M1T2_9GLOM|nr:hypothetical protein GLOIN_2v1869616 [Rhizophagus clarus]
MDNMILSVSEDETISESDPSEVLDEQTQYSTNRSGGAGSIQDCPFFGVLSGNSQLRTFGEHKMSIIEGNVRRDARVEELEQKNTVLEVRLVILEQDSLAVDEQLQNDNEVLPSCICSDIEIKLEAESTEKYFAKYLLSEVTLPPILDYSQGKQQYHFSTT